MSVIKLSDLKKKSFGEYLSERRTELDQTKQGLAEKLKIKREYLCDMEDGRAVPYPELVEQIEGVLDLRFAYNDTESFVEELSRLICEQWKQRPDNYLEKIAQSIRCSELSCGELLNETGVPDHSIRRLKEYEKRPDKNEFDSMMRYFDWDFDHDDVFYQWKGQCLPTRSEALLARAKIEELGCTLVEFSRYSDGLTGSALSRFINGKVRFGPKRMSYFNTALEKIEAASDKGSWFVRTRENLKSFSEWARNAHDALGYRLKDVAPYIGVSVPYLSDVLNEKRKPSKELMMIMQRFYNAQIEWWEITEVEKGSLFKDDVAEEHYKQSITLPEGKLPAVPPPAKSTYRSPPDKGQSSGDSYDRRVDQAIHILSTVRSRLQGMLREVEAMEQDLRSVKADAILNSHFGEQDREDGKILVDESDLLSLLKDR